MRALLALSLMISVPAMAKLDLDLLPLSAVGEGASLTVKSQILIPANHSYVEFSKLEHKGDNRYAVVICTLNVSKAPQLRRIQPNATLVVEESKEESNNSILSFNSSTNLNCFVDEFTTEEHPERVTLHAYQNDLNMQNSESREPTVLEINSTMPFTIAVEEISDFSINDDENEETTEESVSSNTLNSGVSQEGFILPPPPAP